jgi:predicted dehydrogenase
MSDKRNRGTRGKAVTRRAFLTVTATSSLAVYGRTAAGSFRHANKLRVGVIGHTGRGNYGHGLDTVWLEIPNAEIVAVADANREGLAAAVRRLGNTKGYTDYRQMLEETKPDLVSICPRWLDQHRDMVVAAAQRGVRGIYLEKPMCRTLAEADEMVAACEQNNVKLAIAFQTRYSPKLTVIKEKLIDSGKLGQILEIRSRGKEDRRGGGEDLWVLGTHMFNLTHHFGGDPQWCFASVEQNGRPICANDVAEGAEGIGPLAGDSVHAMYRLAGGATAYFDSTRDARGNPTRFGLTILGSEGIVQLFNTGHIPEVFFLPDSSWSPGRTGKKWIHVTSAGVGEPEPLENRGLHGGNVLAVTDLIASIDQDRQPLASIYDARTATEMIVSVFESQRVGGPVRLPPQNRQNPLTMLD